MEEQLRQWEKLEEESFLCWESETARRQQDIWLLWEQEISGKLQEIAEEWKQQGTLERKKIEERLFVEWKGEVAKEYEQKINEMSEDSRKLEKQLQTALEEFGYSVQKSMKKL